jgi:hypothetical protein
MREMIGKEIQFKHVHNWNKPVAGKNHLGHGRRNFETFKKK